MHYKVLTDKKPQFQEWEEALAYADSVWEKTGKFPAIVLPAGRSILKESKR